MPPSYKSFALNLVGLPLFTMKNFSALEVKSLAESLRELPGVGNAWGPYRGHLCLSCHVSEVEFVRKLLTIPMLKTSQVRNTVILTSVFQTSEAEVKQFEMYMAIWARRPVMRWTRGERFPDVFPSPVDQQYQYLAASVAHTKDDVIQEYHAVSTPECIKELIEDEVDEESFNPHDLSVPSGFVGHVYRDEY